MLPRTPMLSRTRAIALACLSVGVGCVIPELDLVAKHCPCAVGWSCDQRANTCVEAELNGGGIIRSEPDAGPSDADMAPSTGSKNVDGGADDAAQTTSTDADTSEGGSADASFPVDAQAPDAGAPCQGLASTPLLYDNFEPDRRGFATGDDTSIRNRSSSFAHDGTGALRVQATYPTVGVIVSHLLEQPVSDGTFYLGTFLFMDPSVTPQSISTIAFSNAQSNQGFRLFYTNEGMKLQVDAAQTTLPLAPMTQTIGRWLKVEIVAKLGIEGEVTVCIDGHQAAHAALNTHLDGGYSRVELGIVRITNAQGRVILYADDFVLQHTNMERQ